MSVNENGLLKQIFNDEDIKEIIELIKDRGQDEIDNELEQIKIEEENELQKHLKKILQYSKYAAKAMQIYIGETVKKTDRNQYVFVRRSIEQQQEESAINLMLYINQLVWEIRQLIMDEEIIFISGTLDGNEKLKEYRIEQSNLFKNFNLLKVSLSQGEIQINKSAKKVKGKMWRSRAQKNSISEKWKKILDYGFIEKEERDKYEYTDASMKIGQKKESDTNVYIIWSGNKVIHYYHFIQNSITPNNLTRDSIKTNSEFYNYDRGWLYQWFKYFYGEVDFDNISNNNIPLYHFFDLILKNNNNKIKENTPGLSGGDKGLQQYKYGNETIISFSNIYNILTGEGQYKGIGIIPTIEKFLNNPSNEKLTEIAKNFTLQNDAALKKWTKKTLKKLTDNK